ncbi:alpha/beta hydrolase [Methylocaldum sp.]|uniref:alpha/beta fold hydrolase n=1 Tax=Methylocaldum sp. TaxID=1969727 RepID=UPI002D31164A|nr:alpha/beta hydrolase [Methylocaldum sp.]HYE34163.1 alpha/beta hydrolase [Methylocaldum sp.]
MDSSERLNQTMTLKDGRQLGFAEVGDPAGTPVVYCHGFPASRLESVLIAAAAERQRVRIIAPDRPGYGLSNWKPERTIGDWADDVVQLADHLGIERFSVLGTSGGGPYGLALAARLPDRVRAVGIVCGLGRLTGTETMQAMRWPARFGFGVARKSRWLLSLVYGEFIGRLIYRKPEAALSLLTVGSPASDRSTLTRPQVKSALCASVREALRPGAEGAVQDMVLYAHDWGFDLAQIRMPIIFWHGEADVTVPLSHTLALAESFPQAQVCRYPDEGHFSLPIDRADEIIETLIESIIR